MTDRDHFAAAALTGMLSKSIAPEQAMSEYVRIAAAYADAMLRERGQTNLDAVPAATAQSCEKSRPQAVSELGNPVRHSTQDGTGNTQEPVAWAVVYPNGAEAIIAWRKSDAEDMASASDRIEPLYRHQQPTLTDAERTAIKTAIVYLKEDDDFPGIAEDKATLLALLERTERRS